MISFPIVASTSYAVTGATNASPIVITTGSNHLLTTGDTVDVLDVPSNTNANGQHVVTVLTATTFELDDTAGNADLIGYGGFVRPLDVDTVARNYDADTALTGEVHTLPLSVKQADKFNFTVDATNDPSGGGTAGVTVKVYGRGAAAQDWFLIDTIDNTDTWAQSPGTGRWIAEVLDKRVYPQLRIDVLAFATSTNTVKAWVTL